MLPAAVRRRLIAHQRQRLFNRFRKVGLVYIHVPRTGGTSISEEVFSRWIYHYTLREHLAIMPPDVLALPRFTMVRNPWDRALSSWSFALAGTGHDSRIYVKDPDQYQVPEFRTFARFVLEWLPAQNLSSVDPLFRLQTHYLLDEAGDLPFDHIGRFERIDETEIWLSDRLAERLGKSLVLPHYNRSVHGNYRDCYTAEMRDMIARIYADDIARFGYEF